MEEQIFKTGKKKKKSKLLEYVNENKFSSLNEFV